MSLPYILLIALAWIFAVAFLIVIAVLIDRAFRRRKRAREEALYNAMGVDQPHIDADVRKEIESALKERPTGSDTTGEN